MTGRETHEPWTAGGYEIPAGTQMLIQGYAMHRNPEYWQKPEEFIPERFLPGGENLAAKNPYAFVPFGAGARMCVGYKFALQVRPCWRHAHVELVFVSVAMI